MKITQVVNDEFPSDGGYQNLVTNIVRQMADSEEVTSEVICLSSDREVYCSTEIQTIFASPGNNKVSVFFTIIYNWIVLTRYLLSSKPVILHAHQAFIAGVYCWPAKLFRTKFVCTSHGKDILLDRRNSYGSRRKFHRRILIYITLRLVDKHIIVSESMKPSALRAGSSKSKINVIYNGIDTNITTNEVDGCTVLDSTKFNILFLGRLIRVKRPELLIEALDLLNSDKNDIRLHFAGRGSMEDELTHLTRERGLNHAISFHGYVSGNQKWNMLRHADLLILPSDTEAFGLVLIEAMACSTPVMAPNHGPFPEIITNLEDGILYDNNSPTSLAASISKLHASQDLQTRLGINAKHTVEQKFTIERCVKDHYSLYKNILSDR